MFTHPVGDVKDGNGEAPEEEVNPIVRHELGLPPEVGVQAVVEHVVLRAVGHEADNAAQQPGDGEPY